MATFRKRGDQQWEAQVRRKGYPAQSKTFQRKFEAEAWAATIESEMARGVFVSRQRAERTTLEELIARYLDEVTPKHDGAKDERWRLQAMARNPLAKRIVASLTTTDFANYRRERATNVAPATVNRELGIFVQIFRYAKDEWKIALPENPAQIARLKDDNARDRRLAVGEEEVVLAACAQAKQPWLQTAAIIAIETGMRRGEIAALNWLNVNFETGVIEVLAKQIGARKNKQPRLVPMSSLLVDYLKQLPRSICGRVVPMSSDAIGTAWDRALAKTNSIDLHFHDLRHEATSRLAQKFDQLSLSRITGHKDLRSLRRYYNPTAEELVAQMRA